MVGSVYLKPVVVNYATVYHNQWITKYSLPAIHIGLNWVLPCNLIPHSTHLIPVDGCSALLCNTGIHQLVYTVSHQKAVI